MLAAISLRKRENARDLFILIRTPLLNENYIMTYIL